jgi:hypothetical protein
MKYGIWIHFLNPRREPMPERPGYLAPEQDGWMIDDLGIASFSSREEAERFAKKVRHPSTLKTLMVYPIPDDASWDDKSYARADKVRN